MFMLGFSAGITVMFGIVMFAALLDSEFDVPVLVDAKQSIKDWWNAMKKRKNIKNLNAKYKVGVVCVDGRCSTNPYSDDIEYFVVSGERINIEGEKYVMMTPCDEYGNYRDASKPFVCSVKVLDERGYIVVKNKK